MQYFTGLFSVCVCLVCNQGATQLGKHSHPEATAADPDSPKDRSLVPSGGPSLPLHQTREGSAHRCGEALGLWALLKFIRLTGWSLNNEHVLFSLTDAKVDFN